MPRPIIATLTDFGLRDHYVGTMKGVALGICPDVTFVDITHDIAPQDVAGAAYELHASYSFFPPGTVFLVVVDPGVGSERRAIAISVTYTGIGIADTDREKIFEDFQQVDSSPAREYGGVGLSWVVYGIFVRTTLLLHATWLVNSATHLWGYRSHNTRDHSTNLWWVALLTFGEGWHNNHHAFPRSARHGLRWWEFDLTFLLIRVMSFVSLSREIHVPGKILRRLPPARQKIPETDEQLLAC